MEAQERDREVLRLRFAEAWEAEFQRAYVQNTRASVRVALGVACLLLVFLGLHDIAETEMSGEIRGTTGQLLGYYGALCAVLLVSLAYSYTKRADHGMQTVGGVTLCLFGASLIAPKIWMVRWHTGFIEYSPLPLVLFLLVTYTLSSLRVRAAVCVCWPLVALYIAGGWYLGPERLDSFAPNSLYVLMANGFGLIAGISRERYLRRDFLLQQQIEQERRKSDTLLRNILPDPIAARLKENNTTIADSFAQVTVLFADIVDFTPHSALVTPTALVEMLNAIFSRFDDLAEQHGLEKIKTIGDSYMVVGGLPEVRPDHAAAIADMALAMRDAIAQFRHSHTDAPLALRIGIHSGPVVAGVIGRKKFLYDLWGDTVNLASRMESQGVPGAIQVSAATCALLKDAYMFAERGTIAIKGRGEMEAFLLLEKRQERPDTNAHRAAL